jgi:hypothetical protein
MGLAKNANRNTIKKIKSTLESGMFPTGKFTQRKTANHEMKSRASIEQKTQKRLQSQKKGGCKKIDQSKMRALRHGLQSFVVELLSSHVRYAGARMQTLTMMTIQNLWMCVGYVENIMLSGIQVTAKG